LIFVTVSTGHFDPLIEACARLSSTYQFRAQIGSGTFVPPFGYFRTASPEVIAEEMAQAEIVIAHAGTGMLSTLYQLRKPCIIVPKQVRYGESNDGQVELARKWAQLGMGYLCMDVANLGRAINEFREAVWSFPVFPALGQAMMSELDLESNPS
jgi:UDP-N-acetylglucosamine transferase subunit ALG13